MSEKINLLNFDNCGLIDFFNSIGEKSFRAQQVFKWMHQGLRDDFSQMSNLSKSLRAHLSQIAEIRLPTILQTHQSSDGTCKWLLKLSCGNSIETVFIPEKKRGTLCVSSQVGCALNCSFCLTGKQGFNRNLSVAEIIGQVFIANRDLAAQGVEIGVTNVVMMGMGEPLLNFDAVVSAMDIMMDDNAYGLSKRRVTLSTSGIIPEMLKLREKSQVSLAVSLHAPTDELRDILVPINKKYPLTKLMDVCRNYFQNEYRRVVTFEYVMLKDVNDSLLHAEQLVELLRDVPCKVNLIPFNPFPFINYECSSYKTIHSFQDKLINSGINTIVRKTRGDDISAACGQLAGEVQDKTSRSKEWNNSISKA